MADESASDEELLVHALTELQTALDLLDRARAPGHIGAHVDLAIHQLTDAIGARNVTQHASQIAKKAELH